MSVINITNNYLVKPEIEPGDVTDWRAIHISAVCYNPDKIAL